MDNQSFVEDVNLAEQYDQELQDQQVSIEDIAGTLNAVTDGQLEPAQQLSDHQQEMVNIHSALSKSEKGEVYAVMDEKALADNKAVAANEGFLELTSGIARKACVSFGEAIPKQFQITAKGLKHYLEMADKLHQRLVNLLPLVKKRDHPYRDVFDFGVYSRFFQVAGQPVDNSDAFQTALTLQVDATQHVFSAAQSYAVPIMQKLLESLQQLNPAQAPDAEKFIALRDAVKFSWETTWEDAGITTKPGQTPQSALNAFPDRKFTSLAPLLDNRYLVAHRPKSDGGDNPAKITESMKHYGASVVFDKVKGSTTGYNSMDIPNCDELAKMMVQTIGTLHDMQGLKDLVKQNESFAKELKQACDVLNKAIKTQGNDAQFFGFVAEYFKVATAVSQLIQQPYIAMVWLYIRCAMVVVSLAELAVLEETNEHVVANRFFAKQQSEFSNPALESYQTTQRVLGAAVRACSS